MMTVKVLPPFQLENLLPYDFRYNLQDRTTRQLLADVLQRGCVHPLYTVDPTHLLALTVEITDYGMSAVLDMVSEITQRLIGSGVRAE